MTKAERDKAVKIALRGSVGRSGRFEQDLLARAVLALAEDAERLDWMEQAGVDVMAQAFPGVAVGWNCGDDGELLSGCRDPIDEPYSYTHSTVRAAIDAARKPV